MKDFIYELYKNENFTTYLIIALVVLIILFVIVLLFGKRDQKLEETKKLAKIELDTFKEEKQEPAKVEVTQVLESPVVNDIKETPNIPPLMEEAKPLSPFEPKVETEPLLNQETPLFANGPEELKVNEAPLTNNENNIEYVKAKKESFFDDTTYIPKVDLENEPTVTTFTPIKEEPKEEIKSNEPIVKSVNDFFGFDDTDDNQKPINLSELPKMDEIDKSVEEDLKGLESLKQEINNIELPKLDIEEPKKVYKPGPQVFSSVFVKKEEEKINEPVSLVNEEEKIVMPSLETPKEEPVKIFGFDSDDDDDDELMDLPTLK